MSSLEELHLRRGNPNDLKAITALLKHEEMGEGIDPTLCWVVEDHKDFLGFIRLEEIEGAMYIRPIIVSIQGQGKGAGKLLLNHLQCEWDELRLVARGDAVGFYQKSGFQIVDWQETSERIYQECLECPRNKACGPTPMAWKASNLNAQPQ